MYDIVLCVYERFRVDGLKRYVNDDRFRVDGDKKYAFTSVCVYNRLRVDGALVLMKLKRKYFEITALLRSAERRFFIKHGLVKAF